MIDQDLDRLVGLPHMRGGVSISQGTVPTGSASSPHAWGCFYHELAACFDAMVFPTCVGVFPRFEARPH